MNGRKLIIVILVLSMLFIFISVILYLSKFGSLNFSDINDDWINFANYFSGILNPILTLLNLIIFAYLSFQLIKIEDDRNKWTLQELARPYSNLLYEDTGDVLSISIENIGLGPMILTNITINNNSGKKFNDFYDALSDIIENEEFEYSVTPKIDSFAINSDSGAIGKEKSHCILKLYFLDENNHNQDFTEFIRIQLNKFSIQITYSDMYGRSIDSMTEKLHFRPWL
ncbi:hypothetical protein [Flavobacterium undicola]|uniref:hypothetical protein n=1 Tax=Flavobacterium undicola TaxID=1932779 RepID=UPI001377EFD0|nr:hypothetical protein [Flavobacterium undicola]MBA0883873.1 hypothetical protein [Flavobacterium undicola]